MNRRFMQGAAVLLYSVVALLLMACSNDATGSIYIITDPPGADVRVGQSLIGVTPLELSGLPVGRQTLDLSKSGFQEQSVEVAVRANQEVALTVELEPETYSPLGLKRRVAVTNVEVQARGVPSDVGEGVLEMLITGLHATEQFVIVERKALEELASEQKLGLAGPVRADTAATPGELLGAEVLVKAVITEFEELESGGGLVIPIGESAGVALGTITGNVTIDLRLIDADTGVVLTSRQASASRTGVGAALLLSHGTVNLSGAGLTRTPLGKALGEVVEELCQFVAERLEQKPWTGSIVLAENRHVYINAGRDLGMEEGFILEITRVLREIVDHQTRAVLGREMISVGVAEIVRVDDHYSVARLVAGSAVQVGDAVRFVPPWEVSNVLEGLDVP